MSDVSSLYSVSEAVDELLREGPLGEDELVDSLEGLGLHLGDDPMALVFDAMSEDIEMIGARLVHLRWAVERISCSVDVPADAGDRLACRGVLELLTMAPTDGFDLGDPDDEDVEPDEVRVETGDLDRAGDVHVLVGPPGWLAAVLGRRAVVTLDHGSISVAPDPRDSPRDAVLATAFKAAYEAHLVDRPAGGDWLRNQFGDSELADDPGNAAVSAVLLRFAVDAHDELGDRLIPPLEVLVADAGLEVHGSNVGPIGTDWESVAIRQRIRRYVSMHGLEPAQAERLNMALGAAGQCVDEGVITHDPDERPAAAALVSVLLDDPEVGRAFLTEWDDNGYDERELLTFVTTVMADVGDHDPSGLVFLAASALDSLGMVPQALEALDRILTHTDHPGVLVMRAGFAADAGDAVLAAKLLRRAGTSPDDGRHDDGPPDSRSAALWREIGIFLSRPPAVAKRNDPCPCGSGRKYKACHQGHEQHPLERRAAWLHRKALRYLDDHAREEHAAHVAAATGASGGGFRIMQALLGGELIGDVTLHEGDIWADFLNERGPLLPDDEQLLAAQWSLVDRSVFEIESVRPNELSLRDLRNGDHLTVSEVATDRLQHGMIVIGRPLPVGDAHRAFAGLALLGAHRREDAIEILDDGDPDEVATLIGSTLQAPQLSNTDGHRMRFHTIAWLIEDLPAAAEALRRAGWTIEGSDVTLVRDSVNQTDTVIASGTLADRRLTLEVNSQERADEMIETMRRLLPDALIVDFDIREMHEVMKAGGPRPPGSSRVASTGLTPDQEREIMTEYTAAAEQRWVDEPVPALRGMTPRAAMVDPIGRIELERLLDSFPDTDDPTMMSAGRLRRILGI